MGKELTYKEKFIKFMVEGGILRFGEFTLKSGRISPYFINTGNYKTGSQISKLGEFYAECIMDNKIKGDAIFGPAYKGIPLAIATGIILNNKFGVDMNYCFDRKEVKDHGEGGMIIGYKFGDNDTLIFVDDVITSGKALVAFIGLIFTAFLVVKKVPGSLLIGMISTAVLGMFIKDPATGKHITEFSGVVSMPESVAPIFCQFEWSQILSLDMVIVVFTFMFIDMFDTIGTVVGVSTKAGMVDEKGNIPGLNRILLADAIATVGGACFGTSTTTTYVESASGIAQGGRSGLTAFITALCFAVALFFSPIFLAIPGAATAPVLIIVGVFMMTPVKDIDFSNYSEAIPAFITMVAMPLCYSISDGIMLGIISYVLINLLSCNFKKINPAAYILAALFIAKYIFL